MGPRYANIPLRGWFSLEPFIQFLQRKVAVVYSQPEEGEEMRRHIDFLRSQGFLDDQEETLELEDMPGVYGLKALRVSVNLESERLSQKAALKGG